MKEGERKVTGKEPDESNMGIDQPQALRATRGGTKETETCVQQATRRRLRGVVLRGRGILSRLGARGL